MSEEIELDDIAPWLVIFIALVGAGLRLFMLDKQGMWLDETFSVWLANQHVREMLQWIVEIDQHPPLYYLLLHGWVARSGDTAYYVRLLSVLFGVATIPVIYLIGKRLSSPVVGLAAAVLLAFSPFHIRFAQEARMYTLLTFNTAVALYALTRLLTDPRTAQPIGHQLRDYLRAWRTAKPVDPVLAKEFGPEFVRQSQTGWRGWRTRHRWPPIEATETDLAWLTFIVFSAATLLTHNTAVLFPLATNIFVLSLLVFQNKKQPEAKSTFQAPSWGNWGKAQLGIFVLWSPWLWPFIQQVSRVYQEFWIPEPTWAAVTTVLGSFLNENILVQPDKVQLLWIFYILVLGLGLVHYRKNVSRFLFLATLFAVPFLGELIVSIWRPIFYDRTLIWLTIPMFLMLAAGIAQFKHRMLIILVLGVLGTNNLFSAGDYYRFMLKEDWGNAAGYVANFAEEGDLILFHASWVQIPFDYYFETYETLYAIQVEKRGVPVDMFDRGILEPKMTESDIPGLISLIAGHSRVWLVYSHDSYTDPTGIVTQTLDGEMEVIQERDFYGGQVRLYGTP